MIKDTTMLWYIDPGSGMTILGAGGWIAAILVGFLGVISLFFKKIFRFFKKHKKLAALMIIIVVLLAAVLAVKGAKMNRNISAFDKKIIVLGFDALSPQIMEPMMREGKLPNFSRLQEQGSYRHLSTTNPSQSPVAWSGFATGQNPGKSGVFDFIVRDPATYRLDLSLEKIEKGVPQRPIKAPCFWNYTSQEKVPTVVITCPVTFPPDKIGGRMLSGMGVPDILGTEGTFTFYTTEALDKDKYIGGKCFRVRKAPLIVMNLIGPRVAGASGADNVRVPFKAQINGKTAVIEFQKQKTQLTAGQWSPWQEVEFNIGLFRSIKGIFKFYLVSIEPEFKLYISPINFDPRQPFFKISYPESYSGELSGAIGLYHTQGMPMDTWAVNEGRLPEEAFLGQVDDILKEKRAMLDLELKRLDKGVLFCYFETVDTIQHMFWRYIDPQHPLYEKDAPQKYRNMIETYYKALDEVLGEVLKQAGKDDTVIVLSDHGFGTFRRAAHINSWLKENGYLALKNPYAEEGAELLVDIDWPKTRAYSIGFGAVYINQQGREGKGIVAPGSETQKLKDEISAKLEKWTDYKYSQPVINKVYKREDIFWGDSSADAPDLYIGFNNGYRASWQTAMGGVPAGLIEDNLKKWSGDHLFDPSLVPGVVFSNKKINRDNPSIYDITPTILKVTGFSDEELKKCNFDGQPLW